MVGFNLIFDDKSMIHNEIINKVHLGIWAVFVFFFGFCILDKNTDIKEKIKKEKQEKELIEQREALLKNLTENETDVNLTQF